MSEHLEAAAKLVGKARDEKRDLTLSEIRDIPAHLWAPMERAVKVDDAREAFDLLAEAKEPETPQPVAEPDEKPPSKDRLLRSLLGEQFVPGRP